MLQRVQTIALAAYRESVRARILLGLAGVAFAVSVFSLVIASFTLNNAPRVVSDLGAASISIFGIAVAIVIGATSLYRELEQKTIFPILARPIGRGEYVVGKYLGLMLTLGVFIAADSGLVLCLCSVISGASAGLVLGVGVGLAVVLGALAYKFAWFRTFGFIPWAIAFLVAGAVLAGNAPDERRLVLTSAFLSFLEIGIIAAFANLLSSFSSPFLSALLTVGVWIIGRSADSLDRFPKQYFGSISDVAKVFGKLVPNLQLYVPPRPLLTGEAPVDRVDYVLLATGTAVGWSIGMLALAVLIFRRRDFL
ncbi:MAG: ABC transporter permease subunit [Polyangiaceae bacterium]|nr:ABC transporter permease subunit [Polyangiaceae bacterium]